jgi:hypothetical protein
VRYIICLLLIGMVLMCGCTIGGEPITIGGTPTNALLSDKNDLGTAKVITIFELDRDTIGCTNGYSDTIYYVIDSDKNVYSLGVACYQEMTSRYKLFKTLKVNSTYDIKYRYDDVSKIDDIESISEVK